MGAATIRRLGGYARLKALAVKVRTSVSHLSMLENGLVQCPFSRDPDLLERLRAVLGEEYVTALLEECELVTRARRRARFAGRVVEGVKQERTA